MPKATATATKETPARKAKAVAKSAPKPRSKKDKNAPKKALSAYLLFANANRQRIRDENPDASFGEIGKILGAEWKEISEADKQKYVALQEKEKERYAKDMKSYKPAAAAAEAEVDEDEEAGDE
ncbi:Non-histone chromosomal protein 6 [Physocladia obscura]|uniref:Non-histone chromosomal protein 6 n=1 Tax=Physocladia obscura TaxID=109957 RepID=A0AAD5TAE0_9FUNG|nr:Non-histone chromosomal protein 6 [Physocladia obscura]